MLLLLFSVSMYFILFVIYVSFVSLMSVCICVSDILNKK